MCTRRQFVALLFAALPATVGAGCGTILYPERRGQPSGQLDWGVVLLDGIGLLVFFIPGVIAFAVDFATGAIYLPCECYGSADAPPMSRLRRIDVPRHQLTRAGIARIVSEATGRSLSLEPGTFATQKLENLDNFWDVREQLAAVGLDPNSERILRSQSPRLMSK